MFHHGRKGFCPVNSSPAAAGHPADVVVLASFSAVDWAIVPFPAWVIAPFSAEGALVRHRRGA